MYRKSMIKKGIIIGLMGAMLSSNCYASSGSQIPLVQKEQSISSDMQMCEKKETNVQPQETTTSETQPQETNPPETQPQETNPPETQPQETQPQETQPQETNPPETQPQETQPPETQPAETQPPETQPAETQPPETQPAETQPPETQPPETQPAETQPPETQPQETQPQETQPPEMQPSKTPEKNNEKKKKEDKKESSAKKDKTKSEQAEETDSIYGKQYDSNDALLAHQNIQKIKQPVDFRFTQVDKQVAIIKKSTRIYEKKDITSRIVGYAPRKAIAYILADADSEWIYVESGNARGFVQKESILTGAVAEYIYNRDKGEAFAPVSVYISLDQNAATTYSKTTTQEVVKKKYAISKKDTNIYEARENDSRIVGSLPYKGLAYILDDEENYYFVESGEARGFVKKSDLKTGKEVDGFVKEKTEAACTVATTLVEPEDNKACYYSLASAFAVGESQVIRKNMVDFALQFVGNPYVWGGTSLTNGADCSGFVQSIYANFGYSLPRVACDQAVYGTQIPIEDARPGDLIFYAKQGYVYHVSMYIGNGQVVQAHSSKTGIITSDIGSNAVWATNVIG